MEGVGARLGRSSTRYGPATVFTGPVRKWKKKWVHVSPSSTTASSTNNHHHHHHHNTSLLNGTAINGNNVTHLLLYKWTPIGQSNASSNNNNTNNDNISNNNNINKREKEEEEEEEAGEEKRKDAVEEPPRRKFKYVPIAMLNEDKDEDGENEANENAEDEGKPNDADPAATGLNSKGEADEKPDINDVPMEEGEEKNQGVRQDLNESTLDLSLGLNGEHDSDSK